MANKPVARKTPEQLKTMVWPDSESAVRDLKANRVPASTDDYELGEYKPGSWQLIPRGEPAFSIGEDPALADVTREQRVIDSLKRKPGAKRRGEPEVIAEARKQPQKKSAKGAGKAKGAKTASPPATPAEPATPTVSLFADDTAEKPGEPGAPANPYAPLPMSGAPYALVLLAADGTFPDNSVVSCAVTFSKRNKCAVHIRDKDGAIVRTIDVAAVKAQTQSRGRPAKNGSGVRGVGKSEAAAKLFMRPDGATFDEVVKITEWGISERFVNRLARANKCSVEKLGEKQYRLIKESAAA
jgi:hypothetical protein